MLVYLSARSDRLQMTFTNSISLPIHRGLEKHELIHIDRNDQRFRRGMSVRLETEDPMLHRKHDAKELFKIGHVVRGADTPDDFDAVVVPLQQSLLIEVQRLLCTVGCDIRGEV